MNLQALEYFCEVATCLSFSAAANKLFVSQPAISKQIQSLESEFGCKLFNRGKPHLSLTPEGEKLLKQAKQILAIANQMTDTSTEKKKTLSNILRIGFSGHLELDSLFHIVNLAVEKYGICNFEYTCANMSVLQTALKNGDLDIIFAPLTGLSGKSIDMKILAKVPFVLAISEHHRFANRESVSLAELMDEQFVIYARRESQPHSDMIVMDCNKVGFSPSIAYEITDTNMYLLDIISNKAVAIAGAQVAELVKEGIKCIPIEEYNDPDFIEGNPRVINVGAAWLKENRNPSLRLLIKLLSEKET